jgi:hypothetical protein
MIPYDELVASLAEWRMARGLATSAQNRPRTVPAAPAMSMPSAPVLPGSRQSGSQPAYAPPPPVFAAAAAAPLAAAAFAGEPDVAEINSFAPEFDAGDFVESEGTELRESPSVADGDIEVDDALDVLDEQDV